MHKIELPIVFVVILSVNCSALNNRIAQEAAPHSKKNNPSLPTVNVYFDDSYEYVEPPIEWLLAHADPLDKPQELEIPLELQLIDAVQRSEEEKVKDLLQGGAQAFMPNRNLWASPLIKAIQAGDYKIIKLLLDTKQYTREAVEEVVTGLDKVFKGLHNIGQEKQEVREILNKYLLEIQHKSI